MLNNQLKRATSLFLFRNLNFFARKSFICKCYFMTKIIIQPGKYRGLYQIILLQCRRFLLIKWWKPVIVTEHHENEAVLKLCELIKKYQIKPCAIYDWSGDEFYQETIKKTVNETIKKTFISYSEPITGNLQLGTE